jgi:uncharacterized membrane protein
MYSHYYSFIVVTVVITIVVVVVVVVVVDVVIVVVERSGMELNLTDNQSASASWCRAALWVP